MNIKNRLRHIAEASAHGRRLGKTTVIAKAAKELDGLLLGANHKHALDLKHDHGIEARSMEMNLHGFRGPFFLDHYALETLLFKAANKIETLEEKIKELEEKNA